MGNILDSHLLKLSNATCGFVSTMTVLLFLKSGKIICLGEGRDGFISVTGADLNEK